MKGRDVETKHEIVRIVRVALESHAPTREAPANFRVGLRGKGTMLVEALYLRGPSRTFRIVIVETRR